ncbi:hypothetical protein AO388_14245 [Pseudomonas sp. ICMP 10191]|nr:hypothetical protein AO388_14245 [Pseudomonas sp. ICMP 10191]PBP90517.1 hypothetical protein CCL20_04275 [Pseudomonas syringae]
MTLNRPVLIFCLAFLTGCVGHYQQAKLTEPHATIEAGWGKTDFLHEGFQGYWAYYDAHCQDTDETGALGGVSQTDPEKNRFLIKPEKRIYLNSLIVGVKRLEDRNRTWVQISCLNVSSFIPKEGATYKVTPSAFEGECSLAVIDRQTGKPPASLMVEPVRKECGL